MEVWMTGRPSQEMRVSISLCKELQKNLALRKQVLKMLIRKKLIFLGAEDLQLKASSLPVISQSHLAQIIHIVKTSKK